jgi:hypothetical protein
MGIVRNWSQYTNGAQGTTQNDNELRVELGRLYQVALDKTCGNHGAAEQELAKSIDQNRMFDAYQTAPLVDSFRNAYKYGSYLDFSDPVLKGGPPRPCRLRGSRY